MSGLCERRLCAGCVWVRIGSDGSGFDGFGVEDRGQEEGNEEAREKMQVRQLSRKPVHDDP